MWFFEQHKREASVFLSINLLAPLLFQFLAGLWPEIFRGLWQAVFVMLVVSALIFSRFYTVKRYRRVYGFTLVANTAAFFFFGMVSFIIAAFFLVPLFLI